MKFRWNERRQFQCFNDVPGESQIVTSDAVCKMEQFWTYQNAEVIDKNYHDVEYLLGEKALATKFQ
jgi:hypothetical protein